MTIKSKSRTETIVVEMSMKELSEQAAGVHDLPGDAICVAVIVKERSNFEGLETKVSFTFSRSI